MPRNPAQTSQIEDEATVSRMTHIQYFQIVSTNPTQTSQVEDKSIVSSNGVSTNPTQTSQVEDDVASLGLPINDNNHKQIDL